MNEIDLSPSPTRIACIDYLRGFDIFCLVALCPIILGFLHASGLGGSAFAKQLYHVDWIGLRAWDMVMPLFIFLAGVSIPLAINQHRKKGWGDALLWGRLMRRIVLLWILGMMCQGHLLTLDLDKVKIFTNTLQAIAVGCLIATPIVMYTQTFRTRLILTLTLLFIHFLIFQFVSVEGISACSVEKFNNLPEWIDRAVLGRFTDFSTFNAQGEVIFDRNYNYGWILGMINMGTLTLAGTLGGTLLLMEKTPLQKLKLLVLCAFGFFILSFIMGEFQPVIKKLFNASFITLASAISFSLLALFFTFSDIKKWTFGLGFFKVWGSNAILAYVYFTLIPAGALSRHLIYGLDPSLGAFFYPTMLCVDAVILFFILALLNKSKIYLRA